MGTSALSVYCGDSGATFSGCPPQVMNLLLLDMKAIGMTPSFSFLFGTGLCLIPDRGQSVHLTPKWLARMNHVPIL